MTVTLNSDVAEELITFKLQSIQNTLIKVLKDWNQDNAEDFINKVKSGEIPEGEMDAITVRQLISDIDRLNSLLKTVK
ncbi:MAG: hypothetical protein ACXAC7_01520 [Candidatus Hodarchaeales archaeon]|jgi:hypothetical protein